MTSLITNSKFAAINERALINKTSSERNNLLSAKDLIEKMRSLIDIFGSPTSIHMKFAKLQYYAIKRLSHLIYQLDDYNPEGGGRDLTYQGQLWNDSMPSDPELLSSIFCHLLDIAYYGSQPLRTDFKHTINHLINSSQLSNIYYLADDQIAIANTQPVGYVPYYEYVYQKRAYPLPQDSNNLFTAMCMVYGLIKAKMRGNYGNTDFHHASDTIFRLEQPRYM